MDMNARRISFSFVDQLVSGVHQMAAPEGNRLVGPQATQLPRCPQILCSVFRGDRLAATVGLMSNRRRRRPVQPLESVISMPLDELDDVLTDRDKADMRHVTDLEAAGDVAGALTALRRAVRVVGSGQERHLAEMVRLGDDAPPWVWGRWLCGNSYRWALLEQDPRVSAAVLGVFAATYLEDEEFDTGLGTAIAAMDALVQDTVVFDLGVLADYLDVRAGRLVLEAAPQARSWATAPATVVQLGRLKEDRILVVDNVRQREVEVLHTGEALGTDRDEWFFGRLVESGGQPPLVFAERPVPIGEQAGRRMVDVLLAGGDWSTRLAALYPSVRDGDLPCRPGWQAAAQGLSAGSSLREEAHWKRWVDEMDARTPAPRQQELMAEGLPRQDAEHLCVLEMALDTAQREVSGAVEVMAQHAAIALMWPEVRRQAAARLAGTEHSAAWRRLAGCLPPHERGPFDDLANPR
jgi:hypothetical protein